MRLGSGEHYGWERPRTVELVGVLPGPELDREFALLRVPDGAKGGPLAVVVRPRVGRLEPWREPGRGERIQLQAWQLGGDDAALLELATELGEVERWAPPKPAPDLWLWVSKADRARADGPLRSLARARMVDRAAARAQERAASARRGGRMRLVAHEFMTLDGVMQGPGGAEEDPSGGFRWGGWGATVFDDVVAETVDGWFRRTTALLFGRTTYAMMAAYWPQVTDPDDAVAARLNAAPKHVVSTTLSLDDGPWASTTSVIADDVTERIRRLREAGEGELQVHGSWQLLQTLLAARLVDELRLIVVPTVIGEGKRVFAGASPTGFEVLDARVATNGCVAMALEPAPFRTATFEVVDGKERMVDLS